VFAMDGTAQVGARIAREDSQRQLPLASNRARRTALLALVTCTAFACTSIRVTNIDPTRNPASRICIVENPEVTVDGFLSILQQEFLRHGIRTNAYAGASIPSDCEYQMQYSARRGWDMVTYLKFAEIRILRQGELVGAATYRHAGGFGLNKYASTEAKLRRLIDKLLVGFPANNSSHQ
jgi:hypothetical protein